MLGLGWTEMLVIGVVALIFIGPKDLPVVMARIGKIVGQIRRMGNEFQREINRTTGLDEVRNLRQSLTSPLKKTADEIRREFNAMTPDGQQKPSGALKPGDPKVESVVDEICGKAGMAPKTNDQIAAEAGFKPTKPAVEPQAEPVKTGAAAMPGETAKPAAKKPAARKSTARATAAKSGPVKAARKPAAKAESAPAEAAASAAKPARKPRTKAGKASDTLPSAEQPAEAAPAAKPARKPRAPRSKTADTAGKN